MRAIGTRIVTNTTPLLVSSAAAVFRHRLLNAARAVVEFDHSHDRERPGRVHMAHYVKPCGAPACVLGHYAMRSDLQHTFSVRHAGITARTDPQTCLIYDGREVREHFGLTHTEAEELFSPGGCGIGPGPGVVSTYSYQSRHAGLEPEQVANYIRAFVARKYPQWEQRA